MKANKPIRDPRRQGNRRLVTIKGGVVKGTTTFPTLKNRVLAVSR